MTPIHQGALHRARHLGPVLLASAIACSSGENAGGADTPQAATPSAAAPAAPAGPLAEASITPQLVALGDSVFHGQAAGGICFTCHMQKGQGGALAPNLADAQWINGDGSLDFIQNVVRNGVPQPKQYPAPMPAFGQSLSEEQLRAVTAYVYSLSHPGVGAASS